MMNNNDGNRKIDIKKMGRLCAHGMASTRTFMNCVAEKATDADPNIFFQQIKYDEFNELLMLMLFQQSAFYKSFLDNESAIEHTRYKDELIATSESLKKEIRVDQFHLINRYTFRLLMRRYLLSKNFTADGILEFDIDFEKFEGLMLDMMIKLINAAPSFLLRRQPQNEDFTLQNFRGTSFEILRFIVAMADDEYGIGFLSRQSPKQLDDVIQDAYIQFRSIQVGFYDSLPDYLENILFNDIQHLNGKDQRTILTIAFNNISKIKEAINNGNLGWWREEIIDDALSKVAEKYLSTVIIPTNISLANFNIAIGGFLSELKFAPQVIRESAFEIISSKTNDYLEMIELSILSISELNELKFNLDQTNRLKKILESFEIPLDRLLRLRQLIIEKISEAEQISKLRVTQDEVISPEPEKKLNTLRVRRIQINGNMVEDFNGETLRDQLLQYISDTFENSELINENLGKSKPMNEIIELLNFVSTFNYSRDNKTLQSIELRMRDRFSSFNKGEHFEYHLLDKNKNKIIRLRFIKEGNGVRIQFFEASGQVELPKSRFKEKKVRTDEVKKIEILEKVNESLGNLNLDFTIESVDDVTSEKISLIAYVVYDSILNSHDFHDLKIIVNYLSNYSYLQEELRDFVAELIADIVMDKEKVKNFKVFNTVPTEERPQILKSISEKILIYLGGSRNADVGAYDAFTPNAYSYLKDQDVDRLSGSKEPIGRAKYRIQIIRNTEGRLFVLIDKGHEEN